MLLFGIGTIPMMSSVTYLNSIMKVSFRNKIQKAIPYVGVIIGILFILRGLGLGIPYVSPANMSLFIQETPNCH
jgi:sulfite exporter TauE/SafE